ncbi:MAG: lipid-A-disaccharide synthase [Planctomycetes bacterium]|nr:lipid-A-disaccharide synthase [Planctomycetota bacterium]
MKLPIPIEVGLTLLRELVRVFGLPWHLLVHRFQRDRWRHEIERALAQPASSNDAAGLDAFGARSDGRGHVFISAGEASGEAHAANLVRAVGRGARWTAFGGSLLRETGADVVYPLSEHAVMGIGGVLKSLPFVVRAHRRFLELLRDDPPSLVVLVDYPGLHLVMARAARKRGIPVLHYIAPQYWGWGPWRMRRYRAAIDATLTILPFEAPFYEAQGLASAYVGHPLLDQLHGEDPPERDELLCLMPGSRSKELEQHLGPMTDIARELRVENPNLRVVLPHRDPRRADRIRAMLDDLRADFVEFVSGDTEPWLRRARAVLVKSGTGSLEACLCGAPTVVVYALGGRLMRWMHAALLNVPFIAGANLIANRRVAPEFVIHASADWDAAKRAVATLFVDGPERDAALDGVRMVRDRLGAPGASARAARWVRPFCIEADAE